MYIGHFYVRGVLSVHALLLFREVLAIYWKAGDHAENQKDRYEGKASSYVVVALYCYL